MSLDATPTKITRFGSVTIRPAKDGRVQVVVKGFEGQGCSCRDVAVLACLWAAGELQREAMLTVQAPGGGSIGVD